MEIELCYNPLNKKFSIFKDYHFIMDTDSENVAIEEFLLYKCRSDKEVESIAESYKQVSKTYLDLANNNFEMEV